MKSFWLGLVVAGACAGADVREVSGTVQDCAFEKGAWRLTGETVYAATNRTPRFRGASTVDLAGQTLTLRMKDRTWDNTWLEGCTFTNSAATPARLVFPTEYGKYHVATPHWRGGAQNVIDVSKGRFYIRTKVDGADCWTLRLGADGAETVMGGGVTGSDAGRYAWAGPVEVAGEVLFADDTTKPEGGWGCTLTGPLSGPATASVVLDRAFCLRLASPVCTYAGGWRLCGGGNGTYRCRLELLKGAAFSGKSVRMVESDFVLDGDTVFHLPPVRVASGDCRLVGGAEGSSVAGICKRGKGTLTLDAPLEVTGTLRLEEGTVAWARNGRTPVLHRMVCLPGTVLDLNGNDLVVDELAGHSEIRNAGTVTIRRQVPDRPPVARAAGVLKELAEIGRSRQFLWAWTETWDTWQGLRGEWPRFRSRVGELTGCAPRVMYYDLATVTGSRERDGYFEGHRQVVSDAIRVHWRACRGVPVFSWHMDHPCTTNHFPKAWYRYKCPEHRNVIKDILDGTAYPCGAHSQGANNVRPPFARPRDWYFARLDEIAAFLNRLLDDNGDRIPVILRYEHEMDGAWFWWGHTWCTPAEFVAFSRMTADYLRAKCGREHLLFAYTPDRTWTDLGAEGDGQHTFLSWYPGDDYVDIVGFDDYSIGKGKTPEKREENFAETLRKLRLVSEFARTHGKVAALTETGCKDANDDFWTCLRRLATAEGVDCAFADTWSGPWTYPETEASRADLLRFVADPAVITIPDAQLQINATTVDHLPVATSLK